MELSEIIDLQKNNKINEAEQGYLELLKTSPNDAQVLKHLGILYLQKQDYINAKDYLIKSYNLCEDNFIAENIALIFYIEKDYFSAQKYFEKAIEKKLNYDVLDLLDNCYRETGYQENQLVLYLRLLKDKPNSLSYLQRVAELSMKLNKKKDAMKYFAQILRKTPNDYVAHNNIGLLLENESRYEEAKEHYLKSNKIKNNYFANYNLGVIERNAKNFEASIKYLKEALKIAPESKLKDNLYSLSMSYLANKDFEIGYKYFKQCKLREFAGAKEEWDGIPHPDKTLLIFCQCGYGDYLQFCRYFLEIKPLFKNIIIMASKPLKKLFEENFPFAKCYSEGIPEHDYSLFMPNAPYELNLDFDNIPYIDGYLKANQEKVEYFKKEIFNTTKKKIGICWSGSNKFQRNMKNRRIPLQYFKQLKSVPDTEFYLVQTEDFYDEVKEYPEFINLAPYIKDFSDTAAIMKNLDMLVSIDSSPLHLAGALGVKAVMFLPYSSDWRWFDNQEQTDWYTSVKIIRMDAKPNYEKIMNEAAKFIKEL